jgi:CheY-like chemotaxis protein
MMERAGTERRPAAVCRILVVDDSKSIQEAVRAAFAREPGVTVAVAGDLDAAEASLAHSMPDLVLCDVVLPGRSGYELCQALKARPATRRLPVLLLSSAFEPFDAERARQAGADAVVGKPFTSDELRQRIREALGGDLAPAITDVEAEDLLPDPEAGAPASPTAELARLLVEPLAERLAGPLADELERRLAGPGALAETVRRAVEAAAERLVRRRLAELEEVVAGDGTPRSE